METIETVRASLDAAIAEAAAANRRALTFEAALSAGLPVEHAARLQGNTRDELMADAAALKVMIPGASAAPPAPLSGGSRGGNVGSKAGTITEGADLWRARNPEVAERIPGDQWRVPGYTMGR